MKLKVIKVLAFGSYKRFMWFEVQGFSKSCCVRIDQSLYEYLISCGVPTSQSLRYKKGVKHG